LRLPYQWWRLLHASLAALVLLVGLAHISQVRHYLANPWKQGLWITIATASAAGVIYARVVQPYRLRRHPYRVTAVELVAHRIWAIKLAPLRGRALRFRPGQFAFVTFADSPFALEQHPFSLASSSHDPETIEFAIRELGDFTSTIGTLEVDQPAFVHGPFGSLVIADDDPADLVLLAGGIGLTPLLSIVRSRRDAGDQRQILLIHAVNTVDDLAYQQELTDYSADETMQFTYVPVVADPPPEWTGDVGYITSELIANHLGGHDLTTPRYLLCGPPPMMEALEKALRSVGVRLDRIDSERFDLGAANAVGERHQRIRRAVLLLGAVLVALTALVAL
ncbi:MAG: hypothetical protein OEV40_30240, partial [Acidimicrobiia bacterium]|nr:hypothetical protein [Acidimicrobiia bacterium]